MEATEVCKQIAEKIGPQLSELGVEGFVFVAYVNDGDGKISRVTLGGNTSGNTAYSDGLRAMQMLAERWGQGQL